MPIICIAIIITFSFFSPAYAQSLSLDMNGDGLSLSSHTLQLMALMTILSLAPSILMIMTSFTRLIIVLSFLRNALGLQQTPPNMVLVSLALFLTGFIMTPVFEEAYSTGVKPLIEKRISEEEALEKIASPFHRFMLKHTREKDLLLFIDLSEKKEIKTIDDTPFTILIPAFVISELRRAFEIGFLLFIPFLVIDMLVSSVLMAMGMMMLPPVMISLPFKVIFFVLIDGWHMVAGSLVKSYAN